MYKREVYEKHSSEECDSVYMSEMDLMNMLIYLGSGV